MKPGIRSTFILALVLIVLAPSWAGAQVTFTQIVVFGTSLSDPGNVFALTGEENTAPYDKLDPFLIPSAPYARGGHHFSNGTTWIEQFAEPLGLAGNVRPAFQGANHQATNYAVGGARAWTDTGSVDLSEQVNRFLADFGTAAPPDALYVVEVGTNDVRDAVVAGAAGGGIITAALTAIHDNITTLYLSGARKFLVANVPDLGLTPAIRTLDSLQPGAAQLASVLSQTFNSGLDNLLSGLQATLPGSQIVRLDVYQTVNALTATPPEFGLSDVTAPCVTPNLAPFTCKAPGEFLFWDGVHPTKVVHAIFAREAAQALAE
jgi:phospholipase/lecithinase/hemolysin